MKNICILAALALAVSSCGNKTENIADTSVRDTTAQACDSNAVAQTKDSLVAEESVEKKPEISIKKGIYKATRREVVKKGPSAKSGNMRSAYDGVPGAEYVASGTWLEATGEVKDGYAKVKEHLIEDESAATWEKNYGWVPIDCLKPTKCNHRHLLADGQI